MSDQGTRSPTEPVAAGRHHLPVVSGDTAGVADFTDFTDSQGVTWRRGGYCCRCGSCCLGNPEDPLASPTEPCPKFIATAEGGSCSVHEDGSYWYYERACKVWPQHPDSIRLHPRCTYTFSRVA